MKNANHCFFLSFFLFLFVVLPAGSFSLHAQPIRRLGVDEGLSSRYTFNTVQDKKGFVWISTRFGVDRFDGCNVKKYPIDILHGSQSPMRAVQVMLDRDSALYAFTSRGGAIYKYRPERDEFVLLHYLNQYVRTVCFDSNNTIWVGDRRELLLLKNDGKPASVLNFRDKNDEIKAVKVYDNNHLLVASTKTVYKLNIVTRETSPLTGNLKFCDIESCYFDAELKLLWIGSTSRGVYVYDVQKKTLKHIRDPRLAYHPVLCIEKVDNHHLMVGTDGAGAFVLNVNTLKTERFYSSRNDEATRISGNAIYDIHKDREERIWIATFADGVSILNPSKTGFSIIKHEENNENSLHSNVVCSMLEDDEKNLWFATNNGLSRWNVKKNQWTTLLKQKNVLNLFLDSKGCIWAGTYSSGMYVFDCHGRLQDTIVAAADSGNVPGTNFVYSISEDASGNIWFGGRRGNLTRYNVAEKLFEQLPVTLVNHITPRNESEMLIATELGCFTVRLADKEAKPCGFNKNLKSIFITDIYPESDSILWLSTYGSGLNRCNYYTGSVQSFSLNEGLPSGILYSLLPDEDGNLWFSSEQGLGFFDTKTHEVCSYSEIDGISGTEFRSLSRLKDSKGLFYFGSYEGVTCFNPRELQKRKPSGRLFFQDFFIFNQMVKPEDPHSPLHCALDNTSEIKLRYNQHSFSLHFTAIDYANGQNRRFTWMLDGIDRDYNTPTDETTANYTNIGAGNYTFRLRYLGDGKTILDERKLILTVTPAFYNTVWMKIIVLLLLAAVTLWISNYCRLRLRRKQAQERIQFMLSMANKNIEELEADRNHYKNLLRQFVGADKTVETTNRELDAEFIRQATIIAEQNVANADFSVSDFAREMGLSRSLLYTKFNALTGYTPNDYIKIVRMKKAIEYFRKNKYTINEVAFMVGFEEPAYFSTCFKKIYGMSPKSFIEANIS